MTPKEKAKELVNKYYCIFGDGYLGEEHIQCALIAVDEIIKAIDWQPFGFADEAESFWQEVKKELEAL